MQQLSLSGGHLPMPDATTFVVDTNEVRHLPSRTYHGRVSFRRDDNSVRRANIDTQCHNGRPLESYVGKIITCVGCRCEFMFSAGEQAIWYETYRLPVEVIPNRCSRCRQLIQLKKQYDSQITQALTTNEVVLKREVVALLGKMLELGFQLPAKMAERRNALTNQLRKAGDN